MPVPCTAERRLAQLNSVTAFVLTVPDEIQCKPASLIAGRCIGCCPFVTYILYVCFCLCMCVCLRVCARTWGRMTVIWGRLFRYPTPASLPSGRLATTLPSTIVYLEFGAKGAWKSFHRG